MKIYSNGKDRVLTGNFPTRFELLKDGVSVPFLRTSKGSIRITGAIPEGELEIQELTPLKRKKPEEQKNILDSMYLSIISESDFDRMEETQGEIQKVQEALAKQAKIVEKGTKEVLENENRNAIDINQTNLNMAELAKAFGKEIQADRDALNATSENIKQVLSEKTEVLDAKLQAHEVAKNPHKITKATVGLDAVDNTSDLDKPISKATKKALDEKADKSEIEELDKKITESSKKQESFQKSFDNMNLYGGVGGNEIPSGGKKGQVLSKASNKDGDYKWVKQSGGCEVIIRRL